jgi:hypothetical protein
VFVTEDSREPALTRGELRFAPSFRTSLSRSHRSGITLDGQLGATVMTARAKSDASTASDSAVGPMLNLQIGYSF